MCLTIISTILLIYIYMCVCRGLVEDGRTDGWGREWNIYIWLTHIHTHDCTVKRLGKKIIMLQRYEKKTWLKIVCFVSLFWAWNTERRFIVQCWARSRRCNAKGKQKGVGVIAITRRHVYNIFFFFNGGGTFQFIYFSFRPFILLWIKIQRHLRRMVNKTATKTKQKWRRVKKRWWANSTFFFNTFLHG